jgi:hypothetical protein
MYRTSVYYFCVDQIVFKETKQLLELEMYHIRD